MTSAVQYTDHLTVEWDDGATDTFHYVWLRDNCRCPECRHPDAWERTLDTITLPLGVVPDSVDLGDGLGIVWTDGHRTDLSTEWLRANAYGPQARAARRHEVATWTAASINADTPTIGLSEIDSGEGGLLRWLRMIRDYGFAIVTGVPTHLGAVVDLAERIAFIQETNFGRTFEVMSKPDPENLAYTSVKLNAHTDVPNRRGLPGLQFLHCIEFAADGGESILVDGYEAANRLRVRHPDLHELLTTIEVAHHFQDAHHSIANSYPILGTDSGGNYTEIRFNNALMEPFDVDPEAVIPLYRAIQAFGSILRDPELEFKFKMRPGDCQVFDNRRVLHARAEFDPNTGPRHLEGCYVDRDDFMSRLRVLERR
jgi:gamma-butyrobetaine dioxygenase